MSFVATRIALAAASVPAYAVGGDWYEWAEEEDGVWFGVADAAGAGVAAVKPSLLALGAFRAARRAGATLEQTGRLVDAAVKDLDDPGRFVTALLGHLDPDTRVLRWLRFGHPLPVLASPDGWVEAFGEDTGYVPLGLLGDEPLVPAEIELAAGERLLVTTDGVWERRCEAGGRFDLDGIRAAVAPSASASETVAAVMEAVRTAAVRPPEDDATVLCVAVGA